MTVGDQLPPTFTEAQQELWDKGLCTQCGQPIKPNKDGSLTQVECEDCRRALSKCGMNYGRDRLATSWGKAQMRNEFLRRVGATACEPGDPGRKNDDE